MTITKLDNIFNVLCQNMPDINFYHFGFANEINEEGLINNFNPPSTVPNARESHGFPAVYFTPPSGTMQAGFKNQTRESFVISLYFIDLQGRTNKGIETGQNKSEQWTELQLIANRFFNALGELFKSGQYAIPIRNFNFDTNANGFTQKLVWVEYTFTIPLSDSGCVDISDINIEDIKTQINADSTIETDSLENNY